MTQPTTDPNQAEREDDWLDEILFLRLPNTVQSWSEIKAAIKLHEQETVAKAMAGAEIYGRLNEHSVISSMFSNEELAKLDPSTIKGLKRRKAELQTKAAGKS